MKELVSVKDVSFRYDREGKWAVNDVSFSVYESEWLAIVGHNGSGKSTLAKLMNGLLLPETGTVSVEGFSTAKETDIADIRRRLGVVFQNPDNQFVGTTVRDDVAFGLENNGVARDIMKKRIQESLKSVGMIEFLDQEPHHLSGGQKQRVAIAGIIALRPSIMILDEATSMLDPRGRLEVINTVRSLNDEGAITVISITHDLEEAAKADRVLVMNQGEVHAAGRAADIFSKEEELTQIGLDLPFSVKLSHELSRRGILSSGPYLSQEELVDALWKLKSQT
ncbi:energy-coupling factor ABC transporter ATP-binding protein [Bacillus marinisedimentorum]|uniref:energy-coupling factor ABC transporter ATP-binding protein n=1 Tax=Bacillus marinisedimentorum TaxID=1821260 RepID=UPI000872EAD4|nr:energy-coupling factor ABC transporter ATP-binding protein [Bacillus marinisedimentorum]